MFENNLWNNKLTKDLIFLRYFQIIQEKAIDRHKLTINAYEWFLGSINSNIYILQKRHLYLI